MNSCTFRFTDACDLDTRPLPHRDAVLEHSMLGVPWRGVEMDAPKLRISRSYGFVTGLAHGISRKPEKKSCVHLGQYGNTAIEIIRKPGTPMCQITLFATEHKTVAKARIALQDNCSV
jgi:hypothetical protein